VSHSVVTVTFTSFSATRTGAGEGLILTEPPVLITEKPGPGVAVGNGVGDGSGELWGTAAGETVIISQEMVDELSDEVAGAQHRGHGGWVCNAGPR
jgi:hypothetical protein